jgi:hypothetical protein
MKPIPLEVTMMKRIGELNAERVHDLNQIGGLQAENAFLKAEVEQFIIFCNCTLIPNKLLQAQVERLTKAGDAMLLALNKRDDFFDNSDKVKGISDWNAAKEGKQP